MRSDRVGVLPPPHAEHRWPQAACQTLPVVAADVIRHPSVAAAKQPACREWPQPSPDRQLVNHPTLADVPLTGLSLCQYLPRFGGWHLFLLGWQHERFAFISETPPQRQPCCLADGRDCPCAADDGRGTGQGGLGDGNAIRGVAAGAPHGVTDGQPRRGDSCRRRSCRDSRIARRRGGGHRRRRSGSARLRAVYGGRNGDRYSF